MTETFYPKNYFYLQIRQLGNFSNKFVSKLRARKGIETKRLPSNLLRQYKCNRIVNNQKLKSGTKRGFSGTQLRKLVPGDPDLELGDVMRQKSDTGWNNARK